MFFIEFKSKLSCPVDIHLVCVVLLSAITEMKFSVPLQTWALIPHINPPLFSLFMLLSSKRACLVELAPVSHQEQPFGSVGLTKH